MIPITLSISGFLSYRDPVEIDSNSGVPRAVGMEYYIAEQRMELLTQVRGNYVATESK